MFDSSDADLQALEEAMAIVARLAPRLLSLEESSSSPLSRSPLLALDDACLEASRACTAFYRRVAVEEGPEIVRPFGGARGGDVKGGPRLLVVDDQPRTAELFRKFAPDLVLSGPSEGRPFAASWTEAEAALARNGRLPDAVVLDLRFEIADEELLPDRRPLGESAAGKRERRERRDRQGLYILERLRRRAPDLPVVLTTAHEDIPFEDEARRLRADAFTYTVGEDETTGEGLVRVVRRVLAERDAAALDGPLLLGPRTPRCGS